MRKISDLHKRMAKIMQIEWICKCDSCKIAREKEEEEINDCIKEEDRKTKKSILVEEYYIKNNKKLLGNVYKNDILQK